MKTTNVKNKGNKNNILRMLNAYSRVFEPSLQWEKLSKKNLTALWNYPPKIEGFERDEWCLLYYKRQILRIVAFYSRSSEMSEKKYVDLFTMMWSCCIRQPGSTIGHWLSQIVCGPITQKSLDKIHEKTFQIEGKESESKVLSSLFTGLKVDAKTALLFYISQDDKIVLEREICTTDISQPYGERSDCISIEDSVVRFRRPLSQNAARLMGNLTSLEPANLATMILWKPDFTTRPLQEHIYSILRSCIPSLDDHWSISAMRLLSNMITIDGKINAINRNNIQSKRRDNVSKALFEVPTKHLLNSTNSFLDIGSSAAFFFGLPFHETGVNYAHVKVDVDHRLKI